MNGKAAAERLNINSGSGSDDIFRSIAAVFQLPYPNPEDYGGKAGVLLAEAFAQVILYGLHKTEVARNTVQNLERMLDQKNGKIRTLTEERDQAQKILEENQNASKDMMVQHQRIKERVEKLEKENKILLEQNQKLTEQLAYLKKDKFGAKSEKLDDLTEHVLDGEENNDPLSEDAGKEDNTDINAGSDTESEETVQKSEEKESGRTDDKTEPKAEKSRTASKRRKQKGKRARDLSGLPVQVIYDYDIDELNEQYGEGEWRFAYWKKHPAVEVTRTVTYVKEIYTPTISVGLEHELYTVPYNAPIWQKSYFTPSLLADIIFGKYRMYGTLYRIEADPFRYGFSISRQTMSKRIIDAAMKFFLPVYLYLQNLLLYYKYQQCDETTWRILRDGRKSGARSYYWAHRSSELYLDKPPIVIFALELTRSGDHLEKYYRDVIAKGGEQIHLTSDAYQPYQSMEDHHPDIIENTGCNSHARRRYVTPFTLLAGKNLDQESLKAMDEWKIMNLITRIYGEEALLKDLTAEKRLQLRQEKVKPLVDEYFDYIKSLDPEDPKYSDAFKNAVSYSINQEIYLRRFLEDGNIPIDNNACERSIRPLTILRKNCLFSNSVEGAMANGIIMSLIETARMNDADPFYYIKYLLDYMPARYYSGTLSDHIEVMVPWSGEYKEYEEAEKRKAFERAAPPSQERPHTPRKMNRIIPVSPENPRPMA